MRVVVVTGGIGAGKSTAAAFMREKGAVAIDADRIAEHVLRKDSPTLQRVAEEFGPDVLLADGSLDRAALAGAAFGSPERTRVLNEIVHPAVAREIGPAIADLRLLPDPPQVVVIEVPLLAEAPVFAELADVVLAIVAPEETRITRAVDLGFDEADARNRLARQASDAERAELADVVIVNDGDLEKFRDELERFWEESVAVRGGHGT
jgi:dephospho-CoA kinase